MGTNERSTNRPLTDRLLARPQGYNLFQAISLLERAARDMPAVGRGHGEPEAVRLNAVVSLGFQPSDVSVVKEGAASGERFTLLSPVMSLAGAQGPLPLPFTELLLERKAARDHATADFLDIFNNRFLGFLYRSRKKHHMGLNWRSPEESSLAGVLDALSSLGLRAGIRGPGGAAPWLRHSGLLGGAPRSMAGLLSLLADRLGVKVRGTQFCGDWRHLEPGDVSRLGNARTGSALSLGRSTVLGRRVWDQGAGISLAVASLSLPRLRHLLPGGKEHELLKWLIARYVQQEMGVSISLNVDAAQIQPLRLGNSKKDSEGPGGVLLGWTSWLVSKQGRSGEGLPPARLRLDRQRSVHA